MAYKDKEKQREAVAKAARKYRAKVKGITQGITVSQVEIDALPQLLKDDINELCDSDPEKYDDRDERFKRAVLYRRKFPDRVYHSARFTGKDRSLAKPAEADRIIKNAKCSGSFRLVCTEEPLKLQSHSPMMVGYVPPEETG